MSTQNEALDDTALMSYRERAEVDLARVVGQNKVWWQHIATAAVWSLLAIAKAIEQQESRR